MSLIDNDSFYIGICKSDLDIIESNNNDLSILANENNAYRALENIINGIEIDTTDNSRYYRIGNGVYFVHGIFLFARMYSKKKSHRTCSDEVILKVSIKKIISDPNIKILNFLSEDTHYLFYKTALTLKKMVAYAKEALTGEKIFDFNFDSIVIDYLIDETEKKDSFKIGGVATLIQETYRKESYTNNIFDSMDKKNSNPDRKLTGIKPLDHLEVMITKKYCSKIDILKIYDQYEIDKIISTYDNEFVRYFEDSLWCTQKRLAISKNLLTP